LGRAGRVRWTHGTACRARSTCAVRHRTKKRREAILSPNQYAPMYYRDLSNVNFLSATRADRMTFAYRVRIEITSGTFRECRSGASVYLCVSVTALGLQRSCWMVLSCDDPKLQRDFFLGQITRNHAAHLPVLSPQSQPVIDTPCTYLQVVGSSPQTCKLLVV
jgi:hypothetical protein